MDPINQPAKSKYNVLFWIVLIGFIALFATQALVYVIYGNTWLDESEYLYVGHQIYERDLVLYDEIWSRTTPLLHYYYGASQIIDGPNIYWGRMFAVFATLGFLVLAFLIVKRLTKSKWAGLLALALILFNQDGMAIFLRAAPYNVTSFLLLLTILILTLKIKDSVKFPLAIGAATLLLMTRMNLIFFTGLLFVYTFIKFRHQLRVFFMSVLVFLVIALGVLWKFLAINWKNTLLGIFAPFTIYLYPDLFYGTISRAHWFFKMHETFSSVESLGFSIALVVGLLIYAITIIKKKDLKKPEFYQRNQLMIFMILGFFSIYLPHFWANDAYSFYSSALLAVIVSIGIHQVLMRIRGKLEKRIIIGLILGGLVFTLSMFTMLEFSNPLKGDYDAKRMTESGNMIADLTEYNATIFIADNEIGQLHMANRKTFPPMTGRYYLYTEDDNTEFVARTHRFNLEILKDQLANHTDYILIQSDRSWLKLYRPPALKEILPVIEKFIEEDYEFVAEIHNALPKKYEYSNPNLMLYKRKQRMQDTQELTQDTAPTQTFIKLSQKPEDKSQNDKN